MTRTLVHRGPDEEGFFVDHGVELGMRRLAVIDVAHGQQPSTTASGHVQVILNGEIYNFVEIRDQLMSLGRTFTSHSDTEVAAHAYEQWGESFVDHLHGMFAVAIWDARSRELILARDRVGKKPLLYATTGDGGLVFASEARAILRGGWKARPDFAALNHVLAFGYSPIDSSAFEGISSLPPAHTLIWRDGRTTIRRYWNLDWRRPQNVTIAGAIDGTHSVVKEAIRRRLIGERPLGVFLSGGIDSTVVAAMANELQGEPVSTFTVSFSDSRFDEAIYAEQVAKHLGTLHHTITVHPDPHLVGETIPRIFDQPFADSSALPTYLLAKFASEHIVVALGGDGGDEAFTGYDRYLAVPRLQKWNSALTLAAPLAGATARIASKTGDRRLQRVARALRGYPNLETRYRALMTLTQFNARQELWNHHVINTQMLHTPESEFARIWDTRPVDSKVDHMVAVDLANYLPGDLLVKADISSMANSLELRSPLLDAHVLEYSASVPWTARVHHGTSKYLLKQIAYRYVPSALLDRPKMGFGIPRARWLREELFELVNDTLLGETARQRGWFTPSAVRAIVHQHMNGLDRDSILWPLLMIELWAREWID